MNQRKITVGEGLMSLSPMLVFMGMYLTVSIVIGDFYKMPLSIAFITASIWAIITDRHRPLTERIDTFSKSAGQPNIIYMVWIFILAGAFASLARETGAIEATVNLTLNLLPGQMLLPGLFVAACLISLSIGTSVGTVVAITPLAVDIALKGNGNIALFVAAVLGGAFFGDNLSFISDTTIASTRSQGVAMNAKFKANIRIVFPAALICVLIYTVIAPTHLQLSVAPTTNAWLALPYLLIIILAITGLNVMVVLVCGIIAALTISFINDHSLINMFGYLGAGITSMGDLIVITLLSSGLLGIIKATGGIDFLLQTLTRHIHGPRGAKSVIATLVATVNICTANNTVAIITVGNLANKISRQYHIPGAKTASLLDTASCIMQCLLPYGAQTLLATGLAGISLTAPWPYLYYPWALAVTVLVSILISSDSQKVQR